MTTLNEILDRLREVGDQLEETMDYAAILPQEGHHRSAMFIRLPHPAVAAQQGEVFERLARLVESVNRPDTIKMDVYTVIGNNVLPGFQPHTDLTAKGSFDPEQITAIVSTPYVLQVVVDVIQPAALEATLKALQ